MKYSLYNTHFPYKQHIIICNTITLGYIVLTQDLHNLIVELQVEELQKMHNSLYVAFVDKGIIIEDSVNEHLKLREIENSADFSMDSYHLIINPTLDCNFKCWYCFENKHKGSVMSESVLTNVCAHIRRILKEQDLKSLLCLFSGESLCCTINEWLFP